MNKFPTMDYDLVDGHKFPRDVWEEVVEECGNDTARIVNPEYSPKFKQFLIDGGYEVKCYMVWISW